MPESDLVICSLPLWERFKNIADPTQLNMVTIRALEAEALLDRIIETFPTYTLHNRRHAYNVVKIMGELLGDKIQEISALETAILILSAYYHDIGMVFTSDERENLRREPGFEEFMRKKPKAYLADQKAGGKALPLDIAEWYCRSVHARRVRTVLTTQDAGNFNWRVVSLRDALCDVCESHDMDTMELIASSELPKDFRAGEADLLFCAIMLRLADIMDFDHTRSPEPVYKYLDLEKRDRSRKKESYVEWRKHLASEGFKFPDPRPPGISYRLGFVAGPKDPNVENDLREFLDLIEKEMRNSTSVLQHCSDRWRGLALPYEIERKDIHSQGYIFGKHRFTMDQEQVIGLFMGENLYDNPLVFVRELLQNAIDASRHREHFERCQGNKDFKADPIVVSSWMDKENFTWVQVEDRGMGMNQSIIENYLLKVASSYYESPEFEAEKLRYMEAEKKDFTPISRFGIGLLSCFLIGDKIEISTYRPKDRMAPEAPEPIRLSISGSRGFYTLQKGDMVPNLMPGDLGPSHGYRKCYGTTVAVRLEPRKEPGHWALKEVLESYLLCTPVPVMYKGERIGPDLNLLEKPIIDGIKIYQLPPRIVKKIGETLEIIFKGKMSMMLFPIDITINSNNSRLKGQCIGGIILYTLQSKLDDDDFIIERRDLEFHLESDGTPAIFVWLKKHHIHDRNLAVDIDFNIRIDKLDKVPSNYVFNNKWLSHNGIVVPLEISDQVDILGRVKYLNLLSTEKFRHFLPHSSCWLAGIISIYDNLRPDISLGRDKIRDLPWDLLQSLHLAFIKSLRTYGDKVFKSFAHNIFENYQLTENTRLKYLVDLDEEWKVQQLINTPYGFMSIEEINKIDYKDRKVNIKIDLNRREREVMDVIIIILVQKELKIKFSVQNEELFIDEAGPPALEEGQLLFPPLFFIQYDDRPELLKYRYYYLIKGSKVIWTIFPHFHAAA